MMSLKYVHKSDYTFFSAISLNSGSDVINEGDHHNNVHFLTPLKPTVNIKPSVRNSVSLNCTSVNMLMKPLASTYFLVSGRPWLKPTLLLFAIAFCSGKPILC